MMLRNNSLTFHTYISLEVQLIKRNFCKFIYLKLHLFSNSIYVDRLPTPAQRTQLQIKSEWEAYYTFAA